MDRTVFKSKTKLQPRWVLAMAWRDARRNLGKLLLFISSIVLGIGALVAISSFGDNLRKDIDLQAKGLLGADLRMTTSQPITDSTIRLYDTLGINRAWESTFASMVYFPKTEDTRLVQVRALEGAFPFYGKMETDPPEAAGLLHTERVALVDRVLMEQFGAEVNDSIRVGRLTFKVAGVLDKVPGSNEVVSLVAAPVYIPRAYLPETGLMRVGSRVRTNLYFQLPDSVSADSLKDDLYNALNPEGWNLETVTDRKNSLGTTFNGLTRFLNLVAFIALLLGCIGVASSVQVYVREKIASVAILRTLGAQARHGVWIYLIQIGMVGFLGSLIGVAVGVAVQWYLPQVMSTFLPFEVTVTLSGYSIAQGIFTGVAMAVLFALFPLVGIRHISPLRVLRADLQESRASRDLVRWALFFAVFLFVWGFAYWQIRALGESLLFTLFIGFGFGVLLGMAQLLKWTIRRFFPNGWRFTARQGLANLYRPRNQTSILLASIGLGATLIATLTLTQNMLLEEVSLASGDNQANLVIFDIQPTQLEDVREIMAEHEVPALEELPVVAMRYHSIGGIPIDSLVQDTARDLSSRYLGEQRVSYRAEPLGSEEIIEGTWHAERLSKEDTIWVSLEDRLAERLELSLGDELVFDVQGIKLTTYVGSLRKIDWEGMNTNFSVVFPIGVLEKAPQMYITMARTSTPQQTAAFRKTMVKFFPTISLIDLGTILKTLDEVLDQITFVIQFMALFSIITGILVLIGSVSISKYQQVRESVLLRTLGGSRRQIVQITLLEYFFLGSLASLSGIGIALIASGLLARFSFEIPFAPEVWPLLKIYLGITSITMLIGTLNIRDVLRKSPLAVLRQESS